MATDERYAAFLFYVEDWLSSTAIDLMTAAEEWAGTPEQADDMTVIVARLGSGPGPS